MDEKQLSVIYFLDPMVFIAIVQGSMQSQGNRVLKTMHHQGTQAKNTQRKYSKWHKLIKQTHNQETFSTKR